MITDKQTRFSTAQAVTTGTQVSTNAYDLGLARDVGRGASLRIFARVSTTLTGGASIRAEVIGSANADLSSPTVLVAGPTVAEAAATAGAELLDVTLPDTTQRYIGVQYVSAGTHTAGAVEAGIVMDTDSGDSFAANTGF